MGLDAVVYVNWDSIPVRYRNLLKCDHFTGEAYLNPDTTVDVDFQFEAAHQRLGNISAIHFLRDEICRLTNVPSFICDRILFDGTHSGDVITLSEVDTLADEIAVIRSNPILAEDLESFLSQLEQLVSVAKSEQNPIVFN